MKNLILTSAFLIGLLIHPYGQAQTMTVCANTTTLVTATNSQNLTSPTYSMNPGGIVSSNPSFTVTPSVNTIYTLYVTGTSTNASVITTTTNVTVQIAGTTFSVQSPQNFTLGCASKSVVSMAIVNANSTPIGGSTLTYTFLPPGYTGPMPNGSLGTLSTLTISSAGTWSVIVRDQFNGCSSMSTVNVSLNNTAPGINSLFISQNIINCTNSVSVLQMPNNPGVQYNWWPSGIQGDSISVVPNPASSIPSVAATVTLNVTDVNNLCMSSTVIPIYQNIYAPNANITSPPFTGTCASSLILTNTSTTGIPPNLFSTTAAVVGYQWMGPSPQTSISLSTTYLAQTPGVYTLVAKDLNNGCTSTATTNVIIGVNAAFLYTVANGQGVFNDASIGVGPSTSFYWNFGDGSTSTLQNPTHTFLSGGAHIVKLKVSNSGGLCSDSVLISVNVSGIPCVANSNFGLLPTATPQLWNVVPAYPWNVTAATWNWGDGSSSNVLYTSHQYSAAGMYNICLTVTVSCTATASSCASYSVYRSSAAAQILQVDVIAPALSTGIKTANVESTFNWHVFPNPNSGNFQIVLDELSSEQIKMTLTDLTGRVLYEEQINTSSSQSISPNLELPSGIYFVCVESDHFKTTKRMIVSR